MNLTDPIEIHALLTRHGFRFSKSMGQNFLRESWVPQRIAESCGADEKTAVLEVGPGIGCLTKELAARAGTVISVELDGRLQPLLAETLGTCRNVHFVYGDILRQSIPELLAREAPDAAHYAVCANLPYNITSPVLTRFTECPQLERITVMIQREVALRICAAAGTADYGAFTLLMQWYYSCERLFDVSPECFVPAPKVTSTVIRLTRRSAPPCPAADERLMFAVIRAAFNQRRKTLANALSNAGLQTASGSTLTRQSIADAIASLGLPATIRGEVLTPVQFAQLSDALCER